MELTGTLGARVASLLMKDQGISYAIHTQKKYYSGSVTEKSLLPLLKVELDPRWLYSVFFDQALQGSGWKCSNDNKNLVEKCEQAKTNYSILWSELQREQVEAVFGGFEICPDAVGEGGFREVGFEIDFKQQVLAPDA
jgi:hypothetical protein